MWQCFHATNSYDGVMKDIIWVLMWRGAVKWVTWSEWPSMVKALLVLCCLWLFEWVGVVCVSSFFKSWSVQFVKWPFTPYGLVVSGVLCDMFETCLPYLDVLLKDLVLSVFLFYYLFLHCVGLYLHLVLICFSLNLVAVVVDYFDLTFHLIFLRNPFLKWKGTCPTQTVYILFEFVFICNMYSFSSYLSHKFVGCLSDVGWICKVDATHVAA